MIYTLGPVLMENVLHVEGDKPFEAADIVTLRNVFNTWDGAGWAAQRSSTVSLTRIRTKALDSLNAPFEDYTLPTPRTGGQGGASLPTNATFCIKLGTGLTGRSARGRLYFVGLNANALVNTNQVGFVFAGALVTQINNLMTAITAANANWHLVVTSFREAGAWRSEGKNFRVTSVAVVDYNVDSQRRRLIGRGRA
jgi:hypothetical protein